MNYGINRCMVAVLLGVSMAAVVAPSYASEPSAESDPLQSGGYIVPKVSYIQGSKGDVRHGVLGAAAIGFRDEDTALEIEGFYGRYAKDAYSVGGEVSGLYFPFQSARHFYAKGGMGLESIRNTPASKKEPVARYDADAMLWFADVSLGNIWNVTSSSYTWGIRTELTYRMAWRNKLQVANQSDLDFPRRFDEVLLTVGLQLPTRRVPPVVVETQQPVVVVPPAEAGAQGGDTPPSGAP